MIPCSHPNGFYRDHQYLWSSLVKVDEGFIDPSGKLLCLLQTTKNMQLMHGIIPYMSDGWDDPVVHLLRLKSSTPMLMYLIPEYGSPACKLLAVT